MLETRGPHAENPAAHACWQKAVRNMCTALGWPSATVVRPHAGGAALAIEAALDQLFVTSDINEWAWETAVCSSSDPGCSSEEIGFTLIHAKLTDFEQAADAFRQRAIAERCPALIALQNAAATHRLPFLIDDDQVSIGAGTGCQSWPLGDIPIPDAVPWRHLHDIPTVLVTGSNGKTTTVRLLAAMAGMAGRAAGYSSTEGVFVNGTQCTVGDYSGPAGARTVLRHPQVEFAVLETARGGILRRGLAIRHANVAIITNVSADHFGEYGVDSLSDLVQAKLVVSRALEPGGYLVLNADDPVLLACAAGIHAKVAFFSLQHDHISLEQHRRKGGSTCTVQNGRLNLFHDNILHDLGAVDAMPLSASGSARYNIANLAGAALAAALSGIAPKSIADLCMNFGASREDNPGRLERWNLPGLTVLIDYAHNPEGLCGLLTVADSLRGKGRLGLLLGQAGNRDDAAIRLLAATAAAFKPDRVVLKDMLNFLRGRAAGEIPAILRDELAARGLEQGQIHAGHAEVTAAHALLEWASQGDVVVLPVHSIESRIALEKTLDTLRDLSWTAGAPLQQFLDGSMPGIAEFVG